MYNFTANNINVNMYIGIRDFEYLNKQQVLVSVSAYGNTPFNPKSIDDCLDYSKICEYVKSWENRPHVDLVETLLADVFEFCFNQDSRILKVDVEIKKPNIIPYAEYVGVYQSLTRDEFINLIN